MSRRMAWPLSALLALLGLLGCMGGGNSGSETTNGLSGVVRDRRDAPVAGARVVLLEEDHNGAQPEGDRIPPEARTDLSGTYRFKDIDPGVYNLEISDSASGSRSWIPGIKVAEDSSTAANGVLDKPGSVEIPVPDFLGPARPGYLYLPGTTEYSRVDSAARARGTVVLESVAPGTYPSLNLVVEENSAAPLILAEDLMVTPGAKTSLPPFQSWKYSRKIGVNPVSAGSGVSGRVADYPLLVRLNTANFDFTQAAPDGRDLRFSGLDGSALAYEIERWDRAAGLAEIWVRLDSLGWDMPGQDFTMHWGRAGAVAVSSGPDVFASSVVSPAASPVAPSVASSSVVYGAVFHLSEAGNELPGGYRDATANFNHATAAGINKTSLVDGPVGLAKSFAGQLGTLIARMPPGLGGDASFTVTFWMKAGLDTARSCILDFGFHQKFAGVHLLLHSDSTAQFGAYDTPPNHSGPVAPWQNVFKAGAYLGQWTHVAVIYDAAARKASTWMNGALVSESNVPEPLRVDPNAGLRIGKAISASSAEAPYNGQLDELRFHASVLTPSRIRMDFETQKP